MSDLQRSGRGAGSVFPAPDLHRRRYGGSSTGMSDGTAVVTLGVPGHLRELLVDTRAVTSSGVVIGIEATCFDGLPTAGDLAAADWSPLLADRAFTGGAIHRVPVDRLLEPFGGQGAAGPPRRVTHLRLVPGRHQGAVLPSVYRHLGVVAVPCPDPAYLNGTLDGSARQLGGSILAGVGTAAGSALSLIEPGLPAGERDGWRTKGPACAVVQLSAAMNVDFLEVDTSWFPEGEAAPEVEILGRLTSRSFSTRADATVPEPLDTDGWDVLVPRRPLSGEHRHRFLIEGSIAWGEDGAGAAGEAGAGEAAAGEAAAGGVAGGTRTGGVAGEDHLPCGPFDQVRFNFPRGGGLSRVHVMGRLVPEGLASRRRCWLS